jgi:hypothetical protein
MRYRLSGLTIAITFVSCALIGTVGCGGKEPDVKVAVADRDAQHEKDARAKKAALEQAAREQAAKDKLAKEKAAKEEQAAKDQVAKDKTAKGDEKDKKDVIAKVDPPKEEVKPVVKDTPPKEEPSDPPKKEQPTKTKDVPLTPEIKKEKEKKDSKGTPTEPTEIGGKKFDYWLGKLKSLDPGEREDAMKAVCLFGPSKSYGAVPEIIAQLKKYPEFPVDLSVRVNGIVALTTIFEQSWTTRKDGPSPKHLDEALALYKRFMKDEQVIMKVRAVQGLRHLKDHARSKDVILKDVILKDVIPLCKYTGAWEVRKEAILTLVLLAVPDGKGGKSDAEAIKQLVKGGPVGVGSISDVSYFVRQTAIQGIAVLCQDNTSVPAELYNYTKIGISDPKEEVRLAALQALIALKEVMDKDPGRNQAFTKLDAHTTAEKNAILVLWTHATILKLKEPPPKSKEEKKHVDGLVSGLTDSDPMVRIQALNLIGGFGDKYKAQTLPFILPLVNDKETLIANAAMTATVQMQHYGPVSGKLRDKAPEVRLGALQLISAAGPTAKKACTTEVIKCLDQAIANSQNEMLPKEEKHNELTVADGAVSTLANIHAFDAISHLLQVGNNQKVNQSIRESAMEAVEHLRTILKEEKEKK